MDRRLLSYDPLTGLYTYHSYDELTDQTVISYEADSTPIIEKNKRLANDADYSKQGIKNDFWHAATIPVEVEVDWLINKGIDIYNPDDNQKVRELLRDPQYQYLKTTSGKF
jgi:hypothetical protein